MEIESISQLCFLLASLLTAARAPRDDRIAAAMIDGRADSAPPPHTVAVGESAIAAFTHGGGPCYRCP